MPKQPQALPHDQHQLCYHGIPENLIKGTRDNDQAFMAEERVYRRFKLDNINACRYLESSASSPPNRILGELFSLKRMSVNRSQYSIPEQALLNSEGPPHFLDRGVWSMLVLDIENIQMEINAFNLKVVHDCLPCNYSHCEIIAHKNNVEVLDADIPSDIKTLIKRYYMINCRIEKVPEICNAISQ